MRGVILLFLAGLFCVGLGDELDYELENERSASLIPQILLKGSATPTSNLTQLKDPFVYPELEQLKGLKLQAIFQGRAKINGRWYEKGELILNSKITQILPEQVVLEYKNSPLILNRPNALKILAR